MSDTQQPSIILSDEQQRVLQSAIAGMSMFVTGRAGTGKTTLLIEIIKALTAKHSLDAKARVFITASTGVAACLLGGTTLHSFAGIGLGEAPVDDLFRKMWRGAREKWKNAYTLIIDEISMIKPDLFDVLEQLARRIRRNGRPFGGIQVIACGDFHQLPPVYRSADEMKFCFEAASWNEVFPMKIELKTVFRQRDDAFLAILEGLRVGSLSSTARATLATRINASIGEGQRLKPTFIRSKKCDAEKINLAELKRIEAVGWMSEAEDWADDEKKMQTLKDSCQAVDVLLMKPGAQVLLIQNLDVAGGLCNGSAGIVIGLENNKPVVEFAGRNIVIEKATWVIKDGKTIHARRTQFPLILGWAVTFHKSQGMTLDRADISLRDLFAPGQGYTGISRVRSLEGLTIDELPSDASLRTHQKVLAFYEALD
ncbi:MAG: AAA family ATPase [Candidatus Paceibacterota bacterium]